MMADAEFDSFLTIGMDGPALIPGALSTVGIDFSTWDERTGINSDNGAVRGPCVMELLLLKVIAHCCSDSVQNVA